MKPTNAEIGAWITFAGGAVIYFIALVVAGNATYSEDTVSAAGWMTFGGMIAGLGFVPAIILTGGRQLLRSVHASEREATDGE
ncbi:hypothetical protein ACTU6V_12360 [Microbacterium sp. A204]|uniref:hypothetical protein n=1 Tax=Microbacterium sp. A204 TaxID=3457321 RepID=UPI003FD106D0